MRCSSREPAFQEGARVDARRGVALKVDQVAGLLAIAGVEEMVEAHFQQGGQRGIGGNVAADAVVVLVLPDHHGHGVPADEALDAALHGAVAGIGHFVLDPDGVDVRRIQVNGEFGAAGARVRRQLFQQVSGAVRTAIVDHLVERLQPLLRFLGIQIHNPLTSCLVHVLLLYPAPVSPWRGPSGYVTIFGRIGARLTLPNGRGSVTAYKHVTR